MVAHTQSLQQPEVQVGDGVAEDGHGGESDSSEVLSDDAGGVSGGWGREDGMGLELPTEAWRRLASGGVRLCEMDMCEGSGCTPSRLEKEYVSASRPVLLPNVSLHQLLQTHRHQLLQTHARHQLYRPLHPTPGERPGGLAHEGMATQTVPAPLGACAVPAAFPAKVPQPESNLRRECVRRSQTRGGRAREAARHTRATRS